LTQDYKGVLPELQQFLKAEPRSANLNFFVGDCLLETARIKEAVPYLETSLKVDPKMLPAHVAVHPVNSELVDNRMLDREAFTHSDVRFIGALYLPRWLVS
jgi:hypothetical protein